MAQEQPTETLSGRMRVFEWLGLGEDAIYLVIGGLLGLTAVSLLVSTAGTFLHALRAGGLAEGAVAILDSLLLVLMIVEIMYTIRVSIREHALVCEPFLIVALIAGVRRLLILTAEASQYISKDPDAFRLAMVEIGLLTLLFLVIVVCIVLLRRRVPTKEIA